MGMFICAICDNYIDGDGTDYVLWFDNQLACLDCLSEEGYDRAVEYATEKLVKLRARVKELEEELAKKKEALMELEA